jgi:phospholipid/cholesterol/gamma-HCH transport system substrate-binding protein
MTRRGIAAMETTVLVALAVFGVAAAAYVLSQQNSGLRLPWANVYRIDAELSSASGVRADVGAPVNVAGVQVGQIVRVRNAQSGNAVVSMQIDRDSLEHVYADARATLEPLSPLKDMSINLDPGAPPAAPLREGAVIGVGRTTTPVDLSTLLSALDTDTRSALTELLASTAQGTGGQGPAIRRALTAFGPTTGQVGRLSRALAGRRRELRRFVTNLATVTRAASRDGRLATVVQAGNATLEALARDNAALRTTVERLPRSLRSTRQTLDEVAVFAQELAPTATALQPAVTALPRTLGQLSTFSDLTRSTLSSQVRPLARAARPVARDLSASVPSLARAAPRLTSALQVVNYALNEMAYNPPGDDEGGLFWTAWFFHNWNSLTSTADAHGSLARGIVFTGCQITDPAAQEIVTLLNVMLNLPNNCPN